MKMNKELNEFLAQASQEELINYILHAQETIDRLVKENEELKRTINDYVHAIDNLADVIGEATGDLVNDKLIDY